MPQERENPKPMKKCTKTTERNRRENGLCMKKEERDPGGIVLATRRGVGVLCMIGERVFGCLGEGGEMGSARCQGARQGCDCTEY